MPVTARRTWPSASRATRSTSTISRRAASGSRSNNLHREFGFQRDQRQRMAEQIVQVAADAFALGERGETAHFVVAELEFGLAQALFALEIIGRADRRPRSAPSARSTITIYRGGHGSSDSSTAYSASPAMMIAIIRLQRKTTEREHRAGVDQIRVRAGVERCQCESERRDQSCVRDHATAGLSVRVEIHAAGKSRC